MKDIITPVPQEEVKAVIHNCLEQAALVNYQRLSEYAKLEGQYLEELKDCSQTSRGPRHNNMTIEKSTQSLVTGGITETTRPLLTVASVLALSFACANLTHRDKNDTTVIRRFPTCSGNNGVFLQPLWGV